MSTSPIALRDADDEDADLAPIPDAARAAFGPDAWMNIEGDHVLGLIVSDPKLQFARYHAGHLVRSGVVVAEPCFPVLDPATLDALVVDPNTRVLWRVATDGRDRRLGQAPSDFPATDLRVMADGTHAVIGFDGTVCFYAARDDGPLLPLARVATGLRSMVEAYAVPNTMALLCTDGDSTLVVLGVKREGDQIEVRRLACFDDLTAAEPYLRLDDEGLESRMPQRAAIYESAAVRDVVGVPEALSRFAEWPLVPSEPAPALAP